MLVIRPFSLTTLVIRPFSLTMSVIRPPRPISHCRTLAPATAAAASAAVLLLLLSHLLLRLLLLLLSHHSPPSSAPCRWCEVPGVPRNNLRLRYSSGLPTSSSSRKHPSCVDPFFSLGTRARAIPRSPDLHFFSAVTVTLPFWLVGSSLRKPREASSRRTQGWSLPKGAVSVDPIPFWLVGTSSLGALGSHLMIHVVHRPAPPTWGFPPPGGHGSTSRLCAARALPPRKPPYGGHNP